MKSYKLKFTLLLNPKFTKSTSNVIILIPVRLLFINFKVKHGTIAKSFIEFRPINKISKICKSV